VSAVILLLSERERQWKDSNDSLKSQIFELRQQLADFKKDVFDEIKRHQLPTDFAELDSFKGKKSMLLIACWRLSDVAKRQTWKRRA